MTFTDMKYLMIVNFGPDSGCYVFHNAHSCVKARQYFSRQRVANELIYGVNFIKEIREGSVDYEETH
jgi:hypothetical protein